MEIFKQHYEDNYWADDESVSGHGSTLDATKLIRSALPKMLFALKVRSVLDIPCGDFNWFSTIFRQLELERYIGADVVPELIAKNKQLYPWAHFEVADITRSRLQQVDLVLVRDLFGHFSNADLRLALENVARSGSRYLLATTFPGRDNEGDITTGEWRPINLEPILGKPVLVLNEGCTEGDGKYADKGLGLWRLR